MATPAEQPGSPSRLRPVYSNGMETSGPKKQTPNSRPVLTAKTEAGTRRDPLTSVDGGWTLGGPAGRGRLSELRPLLFPLSSRDVHPESSAQCGQAARGRGQADAPRCGPALPPDRGRSAGGGQGPGTERGPVSGPAQPQRRGGTAHRRGGGRRSGQGERGRGETSEVGPGRGRSCLTSRASGSESSLPNPDQWIHRSTLQSRGGRRVDSRLLVCPHRRTDASPGQRHQGELPG